ncbi:MAG: ATP-binding protein [Acutalibacteraceae bacterium]|nr:ATP-binding protein [Acutalibacteraceae bacterium]
MVKLLIGHKGSGKTKMLIDLANEAVEKSTGNVVVIEKGTKLTYDLTHKARLVDTDQYKIAGYDVLFGFISGICAGNYDVTDIFVDSTFKICSDDKEQLKDFVNMLNILSESAETTITLLISAGKEDVLEGMNAELVDLEA